MVKFIDLKTNEDNRIVSRLYDGFESTIDQINADYEFEQYMRQIISLTSDIDIEESANDY